MACGKARDDGTTAARGAGTDGPPAGSMTVTPAVEAHSGHNPQSGVCGADGAPPPSSEWHIVAAAATASASDRSIGTPAPNCMTKASSASNNPNVCGRRDVILSD